MEVYIPKHLLKVGIIKMLHEMIGQYQLQEAEESDSFSDYRYTLKTDPVRKFLNLIYPTSWAKADGEEVTKEKINYLSSLFYSVKGTFKVLDYILAFGILTDWTTKDTTSTLTYSARKISVKVKSITVDKDLFCDYFEKFICALLYFDELDISVDKVLTEITDSTVASINHGIWFYQKYDAEIPEG